MSGGRKLALVGAIIGVVAVTTTLLVRAGRDGGDDAGGSKSAAPSGPPAVLTLPSSIPADCSRPVENEIATFLATVPDGSTVRFGAGGCYGQDGSLVIRDRHKLTVDGNGATLKIITGGRNEEYFRSNIRVQRGSGITISNVTIVGACAPAQCQNGTPAPAASNYGQHGINVESSAAPTVDKVHVHDVFSDGVSLQGTLDPAAGWSGPPTTDATITNSKLERVGRQVISVTHLDGGLIQGNTIADSPQTGIDIEIDVQGFLGRRIRIIGNTFERIHANPVANGGLGSHPEVGDITISGNTFDGPGVVPCNGFIYIRSPGPSSPPLYRSGYKITDNTVRQAYGFFVQAERVRDLEVHGNTVSFTPIGCGEKAAVELYDSHNVTISGNRLPGYGSLHWADPSSTGVSAS